MAVSLTSPITGSPQTGLTSPTYTLTSDQSDTNAKQYAVTGLGGTQTGVVASSVNLPFTIAVYKPKRLLQLLLNSVGWAPKIPKNTYGWTTRKGVNVNANQVSLVVVRTSIDVPAGADTYDAASVRAALSAHLGAVTQASAGFGDTSINGVL